MGLNFSVEWGRESCTLNLIIFWAGPELFCQMGSKVTGPLCFIPYLLFYIGYLRHSILVVNFTALINGYF